MKARYETKVFINCPFDDEYRPIFDAIVFCAMECGFKPRCALEVMDSGEVRFEKIIEIIRDCKFGIHDLSRTESDEVNDLPRFNMPLELGLFLGAKRFGSGKQKQKNCLIFDRERYRYQKFISDIAGQDIRSHANNSDQAIRGIRDWFQPSMEQSPPPGGSYLVRRYRLFQKDLPGLCRDRHLVENETTFADTLYLIVYWLSLNPRSNSSSNP